MTIEDCYRMIGAFRKLKSDLKKKTNYFSNFTDHSLNLMESLSDNYRVDSGTTPIYERIKSLNEKVNKTSNYLKNLMPNIDNKIDELYNLITLLEIEKSKIR